MKTKSVLNQIKTKTKTAHLIFQMTLNIYLCSRKANCQKSEVQRSHHKSQRHQKALLCSKHKFQLRSSIPFHHRFQCNKYLAALKKD